MTAAGLYVHIPFCSSRCSYCDFATGLYQSDLAERYVRAVVQEIQSSRNVASHVDTIYFGGGTPSLLSPSQLDRILLALHDHFEIDNSPEITLEINPGSVNSDKLREFRRLGINRASFGAQTFDDAELAKLGRSHTAADALKTFAELRHSRFANVSFDLIAGLPGQTLAGWQRNIEIALELQPEHLSFYLLEVHSGTPLAEHIRRGIQPVPDDDLAGVMYEWMLERASAAGYEHYEISNLCRPGFHSRHNVKYWTGAPYYGFGCSAHSYDGHTRRWSNHRDVLKYVELVETGVSPIVDEQQLSELDVRAEAVFLGMRLMQGLDIRRYRESFGVDLRDEHGEDLDRFCKAGLLEFDGDLIRLTRTGALLSNEVFAAFV
ncbi:MAG TPA: radical SAM family heme chaperone HemW [Pyrinomonadaceae bacterium]|nr:radical SAM family heme chaperone HemW [Pyrinomonadaceae bacterium]